MIEAKKSRDSLLAFMLKEKRLFPSFDEINETIMPNELRTAVRLAKKFVNFIYGAHVRYNVIFSDGEDSDKIDEYNTRHETFDFSGFDLSAVLSRVNSNAHMTILPYH
jgi:hypothetical protein